MPTKYVSAGTFGGSDMKTFFVTTAALPVDFSTGTAGTPLPPPAGELYQVPMDTPGIPMHLPRLNDNVISINALWGDN